MRAFFREFAKAAREAPRLYFRPAVAVGRWLFDLTRCPRP